MAATLELVAVAALLALAISMPLGVLTALHRHTLGSAVLMTFSPALGPPADWCFPSFGRGETVKLGRWSSGLVTLAGLKAIVLPAITLSLFQVTLVLRLVRAQMLEVLRTDSIEFTRARGLSNRAVHFRHALENTLLPVITVIGLQVGGLIASSNITETVFQWPGMGQLFIQSVQSVIFVFINFLVDLLHAAIDPRLWLDRAQLGTAGG